MSQEVSHRHLTKGPSSIPYQPMRDLWWTKWHLDTLFSQHFAFPLSLSIRQCSIQTFICMFLVPEGQKRAKPENLPASNAVSEIWEQWLKKKCCHCFTVFKGLNSSTFYTFSSCCNVHIKSINPKHSYSALPLWTCIRDVFDSNTGLDWGTSSFCPCLPDDCHDSNKKYTTVIFLSPWLNSHVWRHMYKYASVLQAVQ